MALLPKPPALPLQPGDRIQHMMAFATLAVLAAAGWRERRLVTLLAWLAGFGAAIELFQAIPALNRDCDLMDWIVDIGAAVGALCATRLVLPRL